MIKFPKFFFDVFFFVSQAGGSWLVWLLLLTLPLRGPHIPARPHLLDVDSPSPPGSVTRESSRSWCCDYCEPAARRLPFLIRKELKTQLSGLSWPLFLPLAVRTLRSGRRVLPLGLEWEGLARRGNLGGPQSHRPREPRGWGCARSRWDLGGLWTWTERTDCLRPAGLLPTPRGSSLRRPSSAGLLPLTGLLLPSPQGSPPWRGSSFPLPPRRSSSFGGGWGAPPV